MVVVQGSNFDDNNTTNNGAFRLQLNGSSLPGDILSGLDGNDILDGLAGADSMNGGLGNDTYYADSYGDVIIEAVNGGYDRVFSSANHLLSSNVEAVTLAGVASISADGNTLANLMIGNSGNNVLRGFAGDDILDGKVGIDTLVGGANNDLYYVENGSDVVVENAGEGSDTIVTSTANYNTLPNNVESLLLQPNSPTTPSNAQIGIGNSLANYIAGNSLANTIDGKAGSDTLSGADGNDTYFIDSISDLVQEQAGRGIDWVKVSVDNYNLPSEVENLTLMPGFFNGTGNALNNRMEGNDGNNRLEGADGHDELLGFLGNDTLAGGYGDDTLQGGDGNDRVWGSFGNDILSGGNQDDYMMGEDGQDVLDGGKGKDTLIGNDGEDVILGGDGEDYITASGSLGSGHIDYVEGNGGKDTFVIGSYGYGSDSYADSGYLKIMDFKAADLEKLQVFAPSSSYSQHFTLTKNENMGGSAALDTRILYKNNLVAVVYDTTDVSIARDFRFTPWVN